MATFTDRLKILIDYDGKAADTGLKGLTKSVREAEGAGGKLKAGWASTTASIKANAGAMAAGAGAALLAFGLKSADAFSQTAKAAIDLGAATGLSTEEASRWIAVADDFEVSAEQLQAGIGKITKSLDSPKWAEYGIATRDAAGNARDANAILLDTFDMLGRVTNETERARIGQELFGRGFSSLSPLIGQTRSEYEKMLGSVEDGQVITADEAKKAEKWRLAMDKLSDTFGELSLSVGETVTEMAPMLYTMSQLVKIANELALTKPPGFVETGGDATEYLKAWYIEGVKAGDAMQYLTDKGLSAALAAEVVAKYGGEAARSALDLGDKSANAGMQIGDMAGALDRAAQSSEDAEQALRDYYETVVNAADGSLDYADAVDRAEDAQADLAATLAAGTASWEDIDDSARGAAQATISAAKAGVELSGQSLNTKAGIDALIAALQSQAANLAPGSPLRQYLAQYIADLQAIPRDITTTVDVKRTGNTGQVNYYASGTQSAAKGLAVVGEDGPELVDFGGGEKVISAPRTKSMLSAGTPVAGGGGAVTINVTVNGGNPNDVVQAIDRAYRDGTRRGWMA